MTFFHHIKPANSFLAAVCAVLGLAIVTAFTVLITGVTT